MKLIRASKDRSGLYECNAHINNAKEVVKEGIDPI